MRLLGAAEVRQLKDVGRDLFINQFDEAMLQHSCYYIRLGSKFHRSDPDLHDDVPGSLSPGSSLSLRPGELVRVQSAEGFRLSGRVLGLLGEISGFQHAGIMVHHGQAIDPWFPDPTLPGPLTFALKNLSESHAGLRWGTPIARVMFYDVSGSSLAPPGQGTLMQARFAGSADAPAKIPAPRVVLRSVDD
jgi:deoxycytidine triphosphate deaminase